MSDQEKTLLKILKAHKLSVTAPRREIIKILSVHGPSTPAAILKQATPIDRATVYRTLNSFEELGIVRRVQSGWKYSFELTELFSPHHHHASCNRCGALESFVEDATLHRQLDELLLGLGYKNGTHHIELKGICRACS